MTNQQTIQHLIKNTPSEILQRVYELVQSQDPAWPIGYHFTLGLQVRNTLRQKFEWHDHKLDAEWASLIKEAARRYVEGTET